MTHPHVAITLGMMNYYVQLADAHVQQFNPNRDYFQRDPPTTTCFPQATYERLIEVGNILTHRGFHLVKSNWDLILGRRPAKIDKHGCRRQKLMVIKDSVLWEYKKGFMFTISRHLETPFVYDESYKGTWRNYRGHPLQVNKWRPLLPSECRAKLNLSETLQLKELS